MLYLYWIEDINLLTGRRQRMVITKIISKGKEVRKSNSCYGNYVVFCKVSNYCEENGNSWEHNATPYYFWRKKDAINFIQASGY